MRNLAAIVLCLSIALAAPAQTTHPTTSPTFDQLDHATQALYRAAQSHLVRVLVPIRVASDHPLLKWQSQLDPRLRDQLAAARARGLSSPGLYVNVGPSQPRVPLPGPAAVVNIECAGMILSARGDVLLPMYLNATDLPGELPVSLGDEKATTARLRATDRLTGLTIVRMTDPAGTPAKFAATQPASGSVVLLIAATRREAQLAVWTGEQPPKQSGVIIDAAGEVAGIVRNGHSLFAPAFAPVVEQLLSIGEVRRAELGMKIAEVELQGGAAHSAARVMEVLPDSAASQGGVRSEDVILSLAGQPVADIPTFAAALANRTGRTELRVLRGGKDQTLLLDLETR